MKKIIVCAVLAIVLSLSVSTAWAAPSTPIEINVSSISQPLTIGWHNILPAGGPGYYYWFGPLQNATVYGFNPATQFFRFTGTGNSSSIIIDGMLPSGSTPTPLYVEFNNMNMTTADTYAFQFGANSVGVVDINLTLVGNNTIKNTYGNGFRVGTYDILNITGNGNLTIEADNDVITNAVSAILSYVTIKDTTVNIISTNQDTSGYNCSGSLTIDNSVVNATGGSNSGEGIATNSITIKNNSTVTASGCYGISAGRELIIEDSVVTGAGNDGIIFGDGVNGTTLTIKNSTVTGTGDEGIRGVDITIEGGSVTGTSEGNSNTRAGINAVDSLTINSGTVKGVGNVGADGNSRSGGIRGGDIEINGGTVEATGRIGIEGSSSSATNIEINGGTVTATGATNGIESNNSIEINGGTVTAVGGADGNGIRAGYQDNIAINGGTVNAAGGVAGIRVERGAITIENATVRGAAISGTGIFGSDNSSLTIKSGAVTAVSEQNRAIGGDTLVITLPAAYTYWTSETLPFTPTEANKKQFPGAAYVNRWQDKYVSITDGSTPTDPVAPTITTATLPNGAVGIQYNETLTATGTPPITWTIVSGALPDGLSLSNGGVISGSPTTLGAFSFTVQASGVGTPATKGLSITIAAPEPPTITTASLPNGAVGTVYNQTLVATGTATITWSVVSGALPNGLALSNGGVISGTPTVSGDFSFTVEASNNIPPDATKALSITIGAGSGGGGGRRGGGGGGCDIGFGFIFAVAPLLAIRRRK